MKQSPPPCETARPPLIELLKNNAFIVELIAELTEDEPSKICATLAREHQSMGTAVREELQAWQVTPYVWSDRMAEYYGKANGFLYETLVWNRTGMKHEMRQWIARFLDADGLGPQRILVFGDGLGIDSLFLAESGHAVDYYEVSQRCIRFAKRLSEALGRQFSIVTTPDEVVESSYDAVVCLDVLEHVPDPQRLIDEFRRILQPGGELIISASGVFSIHEGPNDFFHFTPFSFRILFARWSGFKMLRGASQPFETIGILLQRILIQCRVFPLVRQLVELMVLTVPLLDKCIVSQYSTAGKLDSEYEIDSMLPSNMQAVVIK